MSLIDIILAVIVIIFIATDLKRGGLKKISSFLGLAISLFCFFLLYFTFKKLNVASGDFFFFLGVVIPVLFYTFIKMHIDYRFAKQNPTFIIKAIDKICGALTGLAKGLFMVILMVSLTATMPKWIGWHHRFVNYALEKSVFYKMTFPYNPAVYLKLYLFFRQNINNKKAYEDKDITNFLNSSELDALVQNKNFIVFCNHELTNAIKDDLTILKKIYSAKPVNK